MIHIKIFNKNRKTEKKEIEDLQEEHDLKAKEIIKLNGELNDQHKIILDLRDTIKNIDN